MTDQELAKIGLDAISAGHSWSHAVRAVEQAQQKEARAAVLDMAKALAVKALNGYLKPVCFILGLEEQKRFREILQEQADLFGAAPVDNDLTHLQIRGIPVTLDPAPSKLHLAVELRPAK